MSTLLVTNLYKSLGCERVQVDLSFKLLFSRNIQWSWSEIVRTEENSKTLSFLEDTLFINPKGPNLVRK